MGLCENSPTLESGSIALRNSALSYPPKVRREKAVSRNLSGNRTEGSALNCIR
jgi:hypothetical protein